MVGVGRGLRFRFGFLGGIVMWAVRVSVGGIGGGGSRLFVRKLESGCCRVPVGGSLGRVVCGRSGKVRE